MQHEHITVPIRRWRSKVEGEDQVGPASELLPPVDPSPNERPTVRMG